MWAQYQTNSQRLQRLTSGEVTKQNGHFFAGSVCFSRRGPDVLVDTKETNLYTELFYDAFAERKSARRAYIGLKPENRKKLCETALTRLAEITRI